MSSKTYPEFYNYTEEEIRIRLEAFDQLINTELQAEYQKAGHALEQERRDLERAAEDAKIDLAELKGPEDFMVIAHRGWSGSYPENTLIGLREAIKLGCHMIEFDVTMTRDRRLIILHDNTLSRTTDGAGYVHEWDYRDLRKLDAGSWFHPKYTGAHLPSLDEVLLISRGAGIMVNIEIKKECWEEEFQKDGVEHQVVQAVRRYGVTDRVIVSSFRWAFLERIRSIAPEIKTALLHYKDVGRLSPKHLKEKYGMVAFNPHSVDLTQKFVNLCHDVDVKVLPFTINSYRDMEKFLDMNVDGMFTNHPNRLFRFLQEHGRRHKNLEARESRENVADVDDAVMRLEAEILDKARRRVRWRTKRMLLEAEKKKQQ